MYTVYLRTNTVNEMKYVGQTKDFKKRQSHWKCLKKRYTNQYIDDDRVKYGLDNFTTQVLAEVETQEEAWELEKMYIKELNTLYPCGYNISKGGKCTGDANKGKPSCMKGKHLTEETKRKISETHINGKKSKRVLQLDKDNGEVIRQWPSAHEVERQLGYKQANISACCLGKPNFNTCGGFKWKYA